MDIRNIIFYPESHEGAGGLRLWVAGVLMVGIFVACGYLEGIDDAIYSPK
tara:strand:- start:94 stop:243 length:150 start_codon:yes stop_codon:yes gene_type:complete